MCYEITGNAYGSPGAPRRWHVCVHNACIAFGLRQSCVDASLYYKDGLTCLIYTDDILSSFPKTAAGRQLYTEFVDMLKHKFELGDDGHQDCENFIGMHLEYNRDRTACIITQPQKVHELLSDAGLTQCRPSYTPGIPNTLVSNDDCPADDDDAQRRFTKNKPYRKRIGQLLWLARTPMPSIAYQVNALARVAHNAGKAHYEATTKLIRYVAANRTNGLVYTSASSHATSDVPLRVWSDATWAPDYGNVYDNYRSTTGWCATSFDNLLSWNSHRQPVVAQSSTESEWYAGADAAKEAAFIKNIFDEIGITTPRTVPLMCDNQSTIKQSLNQVDQRRCRHLGMRSHFLRQQCHSGHLKMQFVPSAKQLGDLYTKCLPAPQHRTLLT